MSSRSTLVDSIKFQLLIKQLDDEEFDTFLSKMWRRYGRDTVLQLLCSNTGNCGIPQKELIQITSTIITERKPSRRDLQPTGNSISGAPRHLIGEIASFLDYSDYISFSSTNRKMFVDCNSPNRLTTLNLNEFCKIHSSFCWRNYPKLKCLDLNLVQIATLSVSCDGLSRYCPKLQTLCIRGKKNETEESALNNFINDNVGRCGSITFLGLCNFRGMRWTESTLKSQQLVRLLTGFPALTHLAFLNVDSRDHCDIDQFRSLCPRLHQLSMGGVYGLPCAVLLAAFSSKVKDLRLGSCFRPSLQFPLHYDWSKLQTLRFYNSTKRNIDAILKTAQNVTTIDFRVEMGRNKDRLSDEIENVVERFIVDHSSLETFTVSAGSHLERICNAIHRGLLQIQKKKKDSLGIALLDVDCKQIADIKELMCLLSKLLLPLSKSKIKVWRVVLYRFDGDFEPIVSEMESFIAEHDGKPIKMLENGAERIVIGN